jgi:hypothetical protein
MMASQRRPASDVRTQDPAGGAFSVLKGPSTWEIYGHFVPTYVKTSQSVPVRLPLLLDTRTGIPLAETDPTRLRHALYVASNLLHVVAQGDVCDLPPWIRVIFKVDEVPAPPREANRVTPETYETLRDTVFAYLDSKGGSLADKAIAEQRLTAIRDAGLRCGAVLEGQ